MTARLTLGLLRSGCHGVIRNLLNTRFGINLCAPECAAEGNVLPNFSADDIRVTRGGQTVQYNVIKKRSTTGS